MNKTKRNAVRKHRASERKARDKRRMDRAVAGSAARQRPPAATRPSAPAASADSGS